MLSEETREKIVKKIKKNLPLYFLPVLFTAAICTWVLDYSVKNRHLISHNSPFRKILQLNEKLTDIKFKIRGERLGDERIVVAAIDDKSISKLGRWPFSRNKFAKLIDKLKALGAKVVAFDVVFSESEAENEIAMLKGLKSSTSDQSVIKEINESIISLDGDTNFSRSIKEFEERRNTEYASELEKNSEGNLLGAGGVVLGFFSMGGVEEVDVFSKSASNPMLISNSVIMEDRGTEGETLWDAVAYYYKDHILNLNVDKISDATRNSGYFENDPDEDGVFRRYYLAQNIAGKTYPSLALKTAEVFLGDTVSLEVEKETANLKFLISGHKIHLEGLNLFTNLINYAGPKGSYRYYSIADILESEDRVDYKIRDKAQDLLVKKTEDLKLAFKDKIVVVGSTAIGAHDMRHTPFDGNYPGVEAHLNVIDNILNKSFFASEVDTLHYSKLITFFGILIFGMVLVWLSPIWEIIFLLGSAVVLGFVDAKILFKNGMHVYSVFPIFGIIVSYLYITVTEYFTESKEKKMIKNTFSKFVSPEVVNEMISDPSKVQLGGEKRELTVLFSDIRDFTSISETLDPKQLSDLLNEYLTAMTNIVMKHNGTIDKYIGDALMAFWGAPVHMENHAELATKAALEMGDKLKELNVGFQERYGKQLRIGIGLNAGDMAVGNMGSTQIFSYTVIGDAVNLGSRLEGINKLYTTQIIGSEYTVSKLPKGFITRELDRVRVKGKQEPVSIYEIRGFNSIQEMFGDTETRDEAVLYFEQGYSRYHTRNWGEAKSCFLKALSARPDDGPSGVFLKRCEEYDIEPPPGDWDGVWVMKTK